MVFRRRFRSSRSRFKRLRGSRLVTEPKRYQSANFFFTVTLLPPPVGSTPDFTIFEVCTTDHLNLGLSGSVNNVMPAAAKGLELGGIVYEANAICSAPDQSGVWYEIWLALYWDQQSINRSVFPNITIPTTLPDAWSTTQGPISITPPTDALFPMRFIKRHGMMFGNELFESAGKENQAPRGNIRLRRRIGDREGLYFGVAGLSDGAGDGDGNVAVSIKGTLYYRWLFQ